MATKKVKKVAPKKEEKPISKDLGCNELGEKFIDESSDTPRK